MSIDEARFLRSTHPHFIMQGAQRLHDRGVRQRAIANRHTAADKYSCPIGCAMARQLGAQAGLADTGLAPQQDDGRFSICGPHPGRLQDLSSWIRPTKVGLAARSPISPGLSRGTGRSEMAAVRSHRPEMGSWWAATYGKCRIRGVGHHRIVHYDGWIALVLEEVEIDKTGARTVAPLQREPFSTGDSAFCNESPG